MEASFSAFHGHQKVTSRSPFKDVMESSKDFQLIRIVGHSPLMKLVYFSPPSHSLWRYLAGVYWASTFCQGYKHNNEQKQNIPLWRVWYSEGERHQSDGHTSRKSQLWPVPRRTGMHCSEWELLIQWFRLVRERQKSFLRKLLLSWGDQWRGMEIPFKTEGTADASSRHQEEA